MEKINQAFAKVKSHQAVERMKMLVGMEVSDEESAAVNASTDESSFSFMDDFNRNCTLSTKQRIEGFAICFIAGLTCTFLFIANLVSERYDSGDWNTAGDRVSPEYTAGTDLNAYFEGFGAETSPLEILKEAVQDSIIHSFRKTFTREIYEKWGKGICVFCEEHIEETKHSNHDCSHKECSMLIFNQGMKDELMVHVYNKMTVEAENVEDEDDVYVQELREVTTQNFQPELGLCQLLLQLALVIWMFTFYRDSKENDCC